MRGLEGLEELAPLWLRMRLEFSVGMVHQGGEAVSLSCWFLKEVSNVPTPVGTQSQVVWLQSWARSHYIVPPKV